ncbi:type 2 lantibiotic biosynthesis protein LanM [Croceifilum oryzae]|uniref:Type 2 lantibiotic biosynthesis protein LanM n=1 Tax=Croceifilum oryzae TaxID=1553429 RepID=A0AAJ1WUF9_9BACL|nr:type 2 lanthipeptide synthetase LanM family protein [Croceifilum oryzae]MDQ0417956.1 type 2 lantibiotic biosynthesis protein LanM [Croceifilum oryzae]
MNTNSIPINLSLPQINKSLTLKERTKLFCTSLEHEQIPKKEIEEALQSWQEVSLLDEPTLQKKLRATQLDIDTFGKILCATNIETKQNDDWMHWLEEALQLNRSTPVEDTELDLHLAVRPFHLWAKKKVEDYFQHIPQINQMIQTNSVLDSILFDLVDGLISIAGRTLVLELHIAREMGELEGDHSEARFQSFIKQKIMNPDQLEFIYNEYPTLVRLLITRTHYFIQALLEAITRYISDRKQIHQEFHIDPSQPLTSISAGMGDSHQQGRTVMHFQFDSKRVIYKPKSLSVSDHFHELLHWFNQHGFTPPLNGYHVLGKNDYTWEEFVSSEGCTSEEEIERFYHRLGGLLAIVHTLHGVDFHYENIIARGEYPTLIDLETLFHNEVPMSLEDFAQVRANKRIGESVLITGILPLILFSGKEESGVDMSGLGGLEQEYPTPILQEENPRTDQMRYVRKNAVVKLKENLPKLNGQFVEITPYVRDIINGFNQANQIMLEHRADLLHDEGPIAQFKQDKVRIILRNTQFYYDFLLESQHPDYMEDTIEREKILDRLWYRRKENGSTIHEIEDLLEGDIPFFTSIVDSTDLISSTGKRIPHFFPESSYQKVLKRIQSLTSEEIEQQSNYIHASILGNVESKNHLQVKQYHFTPDPSHHLSVQPLISAAEEIGLHLSKQAIYGVKNDVTWISPSPTANNLWTLAPMDFGLYSGVCGISVFYGYLDQICPNSTFRDLSHSALQTALHTGKHVADANAFMGQSSILYTLSHMTGLYGEKEEWTSYMEELTQFIGEKVDKDQHYDLIHGSSGIIHVLLNVAQQFNWAYPAQVAQAYGEHLIKHAVQTEKGVAWKTNPNKSTLLGGFSHGTSGIAWTLFRLASATGQEKFHEWGLKALQYDRCLYDNRLQNWLDMRTNGTSSSPAQWCHGASGIGISRILCLPYLQDKQLEEEIHSSVQATLQNGIGYSQSLCHGDLGNSDLLLMAGDALGQQQWIKISRQIGHHAIQYKQSNGKYLTGISHFLETPGLLVGLSGIGYQLLRLAHPDQIPSVLSLQMPIKK